MVPSPSQAVADFSTRNFAIAGCLVSPRLDRITRAGETVQVEPKVMQVLVCLASHGQELVSKQELLDAVWPETFVSDHVLTHVVWQLRKALGSSDLIETVPRRGYRLTAEAVLQMPPPANETARSDNRKRRWLPAAVAVVALLAGGGALAVRQYRSALARQPIRRIAIVPLEAAVTGQPQQLLVGGINSGLQEQLLEVHAWQVLTARTTASLYAAGVRKPMPELARQARADAIVQGTAAVLDGRVRISVQLWDARTEATVLSETFERDLQDVLPLYGQVVRSLADAGRVPIADAEAPRLGGPTLDREAAQEYLMGTGLPGGGGAYWEQALRHFRRVIALNPDFAPAYTRAAMVLRAMAANTPSPADERRHAEEARALALRSVELDAKSIRGLAGLGSVEASLFWNWPEAQRRYEQAEKMRPDHPALLSPYFEYLVQTRQCARAIELIRRAADTDLFSAWPLYRAHWAHYMCGQLEPAINEAQAALARDPSTKWAHYHTAYAYALTGHHSQAIAECEKSGNNGKCEEPFLLALAGRREEARALLERWEQKVDGDTRAPFFMALGYTGLGERQRALDWLEKGYEARDSNMRLIWDPAFTSLRNEPRFRELTCKINLPPGVCGQARN